MRMKQKQKPKSKGLPTVDENSAYGGGAAGEWELRPGGMLVQRRTTDADRSSVAPVPIIRVRVKYGSIYHEINVNSQATFGELKKLLTAPTGLHHQDQKLFFKDKERDSKAFLDTSGVKNRSKIVLMEDPISQEKRYLEMRRTAKMQSASKSITEISLEVDRLGIQVASLDSVISSKGGKVAESELVGLIELLMNQLLKLDGVIADGDVKLQRKMQVRRVQKYVETLDMLKIKNSMSRNDGGQNILNHHHHHQQHKQSNEARPPSGQLPASHSARSVPVVVTTKWETFDTAPAETPAPTTANNPTPSPKFNWDSFEFQ